MGRPGVDRRALSLPPGKAQGPGGLRFRRLRQAGQCPPGGKRCTSCHSAGGGVAAPACGWWSAREELAGTALEPPSLLVSIADPPPAGSAAEPSPGPGPGRLPGSLALAFADLDPADLQETWGAPLAPYGRAAAELIMTEAMGKKLWSFLLRKRDPAAGGLRAARRRGPACAVGGVRHRRHTGVEALRGDLPGRERRVAGATGRRAAESSRVRGDAAVEEHGGVRVVPGREGRGTGALCRCDGEFKPPRERPRGSAGC